MLLPKSKMAADCLVSYCLCPVGCKAGGTSRHDAGMAGKEAAEPVLARFLASEGLDPRLDGIGVKGNPGVGKILAPVSENLFLGVREQGLGSVSGGPILASSLVSMPKLVVRDIELPGCFSNCPTDIFEEPEATAAHAFLSVGGGLSVGAGF